MFSFFTKKAPSLPRYVYLDHASATPVSQNLIALYQKTLQDTYANPGSIHQLGVQGAQLLDGARARIAEVFAARKEEIIFTSSGTEANNCVIHGVIDQARLTSFFIPHVITTNIEHASVLEPLRTRASRGDIDLDIIPVEQNGVVDVKKIKELLRKETILVSVIHVNNEIGTVQPVRDIAKMLQKWKEEKKSEQYPLFHTDACQSVQYYDMRPEAFKIDLVTCNSSKVYAPRGVGVVYKHKNTTLAPHTQGGDQEFGIRAGTENVAAIVACASALEEVCKMREAESVRIRTLQEYFLQEIQAKIPEVKVWGSIEEEERSPNNINISVAGVLAEEWVIGLSMKNICISSKSACGMSSDEGSYVIRALGGTEQESKESIRITMGKSTTQEMLDVCIQELCVVYARHKKAQEFIGQA